VKVTDDGVPVGALIDVVKDSIKQAGVSRTSQNADLQVASVQLILEVLASKKAGGGLDFCVPFLGKRLRLGAALSAGVIDLSFAVTQTGSISLGFDGELTDEVTHTLRLELAASPA
jgi:hypothetical protein